MQVSRGKDLTPSVREGVDTLLMYLYRALNHVDDMERLASSENSCVVVCVLSTFGFFTLLVSCNIFSDIFQVFCGPEWLRIEDLSIVIG